MNASSFSPPAAGILGVCIVVLAAIRFGESGAAGRPIDVTDLLEDPMDTVASARRHVLLVFQIADCWQAREDLAGWSPGVEAAAATSSGPSDIRVGGVLVGPLLHDQERTRAILAESGIRFPVRRDRLGRAEAFVRALGYRRTPVVLVFDGEGRLSAVGPANRLRPALVGSGALDRLGP